MPVQGVCITRAGRVMLVTEYMSGGDLWHALGKPAVSRGVFGWHVWGHKVAVDIARGLHFLHSRTPTIVHFECAPALGRALVAAQLSERSALSSCCLRCGRGRSRRWHGCSLTRWMPGASHSPDACVCAA